MIDFKKVREIVNEHIKIAVGDIEEEEPKIIFAVRDKPPFETKEVWRVTVKYTPKPKKETEVVVGEQQALFKIDAETGEVLEFKEGFSWKA